jgi:hypothetical protein
MLTALVTMGRASEVNDTLGYGLAYVFAHLCTTRDALREEALRDKEVSLDDFRKFSELSKSGKGEGLRSDGV